MANTPATAPKGQFFQNSKFEWLTKTPIAVPLSVFYLTALSVVLWEIFRTGLEATSVIAVFFAGVVTWTFIEYIAHRWLFHMPTPSSWKERFQYALHGLHHEVPRDKTRLAMPVPMSALLACFFLWFYDLLIGDFGWSFGAGFICGYAGYLSVHYIVHAWNMPKNALSALWKNHNIHHYRNHNILFGVSSPLWDYVFGTFPKGSEKEKYAGGKTS